MRTSSTIIGYHEVLLKSLCCQILLKLSLHFYVQTDKKTNTPKVWIYKDKVTNLPKGEATVTFDDSDTAKAAIDWFDGEIFLPTVSVPFCLMSVLLISVLVYICPFGWPM